MPPRKKKPPQLELTPPAPSAAPHPRLPLGDAGGVQLTLEGADFAAVEAAVAELKARYGTRLAVTGRRTIHKRSVLRITATLLVRADDALDAGSQIVRGSGQDDH